MCEKKLCLKYKLYLLRKSDNPIYKKKIYEIENVTKILSVGFKHGFSKLFSYKNMRNFEL